MFLLFLVGCSLSNSPTSKVEDLLVKYQTLDSDIKNDINSILDEENLTSTQRKRYRDLMERQYKNLSYQIEDEKIDGDSAIITTEVEVYDYRKVINKINNKYQNMDSYTVEQYNSTKLDELEKVKDKIIYTIDFIVNKDKNGNWKLSSLSNENIKKLQGMY